MFYLFPQDPHDRKKIMRPWEPLIYLSENHPPQSPTHATLWTQCPFCGWGAFRMRVTQANERTGPNAENAEVSGNWWQDGSSPEQLSFRVKYPGSHPTARIFPYYDDERRRRIRFSLPFDINFPDPVSEPTFQSDSFNPVSSGVYHVRSPLHWGKGFAASLWTFTFSSTARYLAPDPLTDNPINHSTTINGELISLFRQPAWVAKELRRPTGPFRIPWNDLYTYEFADLESVRQRLEDLQYVNVPSEVSHRPN